MARIRRGMLDGGGLQRRRQPTAGEGGNGDEVTRGRFPAVRASTRLRESVTSVGLGGAMPSEAGDERALRSTGGDSGEHTASGGNDAGQARQALTAAATGRSATTARARAGGAAIWAASAGSGCESGREGSARLTTERGERERAGEGGGDGPRGIRPSNPREAK
uniref:Epstein-Barr virus EBNA-1-like protein n=1 Tax=Oryza sativa subsp. japonica TaxID=39947 RepID=Q75LI8_ORYSJ|nr:hypothetical protein [Oryza sativa Japonica Group]